MKYLILLLMSPILLMAQRKGAVPPGGMKAFVSFLNSNVVFDEKVFEKDLSGEIIVEFRVSESGKLDSFNIVEDIGSRAGLDLVKAIKKGGDWIPANSNGVPEASWIELPYTVLTNQQSSRRSIVNGMKGAEPEIGIDEFRRKFLNNFKYPEAAINAGIQGTFKLRFIVKEDGSVTAVKLKDDPGYGIAESASRALRKTGKWIPVTKDGKYIKAESMFEFTLNLKGFRRSVY